MIDRIYIRARRLYSGLRDERKYARNCLVDVQKKSDIAVVLHLYYPEMWPYLRGYLDNINNFDLYVTVPETKKNLIPEDLANVATIFITPNRGRDVLPFLYVVKRIKHCGYRSILKLHSKKSPHFDGGDIWLDNILKSLTSASTSAVIDIFSDQPTIVGPKGYFTSLVVNFEANGRQLERILGRSGVDKKRILQSTQSDRSRHGFFGGTMFWIAPQLAEDETFMHRPHNFDEEKGQVDGTLAHALERAFSMLPQLRNTMLYEVNEKGGITLVNPAAGEIPEWSDKFVHRESK